MISDKVRSLIAGLPFVLLATADSSGQPHVAIGEQVTLEGASMLVFENWFCPATLENINGNPRIAVIAMAPETGKGYQLIGSVVKTVNAAILDGYGAPRELEHLPQVLTRFTVNIETTLEFTSGMHTDVPIAA